MAEQFTNTKMDPCVGEKLVPLNTGQSDCNLQAGLKQYSTYGFDIKTEKTDLALTFGEHRLFVKRSILEDASPVLEDLFREKLVEDAKREVNIDGTSLEDFAEFLACIQRRGRRKISETNVYKMLELASKYEVEDLKDRCEDCLLLMLDDVQNNPASFLKLLVEATKHKLDSLTPLCIERAGTKVFDLLLEKDVSAAIPSDVKFELYEKFLPRLRSNMHVSECLKMMLSSEDALAISEMKNAMGFSVSGKLSNNSGFEERFKLWGYTWTIKVGEQRMFCSYNFYPWTVDLRKCWDNDDRPFTCKVVLVVKILNNISEKDDYRAIESATFNSTSRIGWDISSSRHFKESQINEFRQNGLLSVEVFCLIDKPVYTEVVKFSFSK